MHGLYLGALLVINTSPGDEGKETGCKGQTARHRSETGRAVLRVFYEPAGLVCLPYCSCGVPGGV